MAVRGDHFTRRDSYDAESLLQTGAAKRDRGDQPKFVPNWPLALSTSKGKRVDPAVPDAAVEAGPAAFQVQSPAPVPGGSDLEQLERIEHQAPGGAQVAGLVLQELGQLHRGWVRILLRRPAGLEHGARLGPAT